MSRDATQNGNCLPLTGIENAEIPFQWSKHGKSIFAFDPDKLPIKIYKINVANGQRELYKEIMPSDPAGVNHIVAIRISPDETSYGYSYERSISSLYFLKGVH